MPRMHREFCDFLEQTIDYPDRLMMAYRESSKSTIVCLYVTWRLARDPNYTALIISGIAALATRNSEYIRSVIETHPLAKHLIPDRGRERWQTNRFNVVRSKTQTSYSVSVTSVGGRFTGSHASEIIADDIEIEENCGTQEARDKISRTVDKLFSIGSKHLVVGTPHDSDRIYRNVCWRRLPPIRRSSTSNSSARSMTGFR
jgi:hypothetical protein